MPAYARKIGNRWQGFYGDAGPGRTRCFATPEEAHAWAAPLAAKWLLQPCPRKIKAHRDLPLGVTYSQGKWYARSPVNYRPRVVRVFCVTANGGQEAAKAAAIAVANDHWLKEATT